MTGRQKTFWKNEQEHPLFRPTFKIWRLSINVPVRIFQIIYNTNNLTVRIFRTKPRVICKEIAGTKTNVRHKDSAFHSIHIDQFPLYYSLYLFTVQNHYFTAGVA